MLRDMDISGWNYFGASVKAPASGEKKKKPCPNSAPRTDFLCFLLAASCQKKNSHYKPYYWAGKELMSYRNGRIKQEV
jgi:hypothetical protein